MAPLANVILREVDWFKRCIDPRTGLRWGLWSDFYNRDVDVDENTIEGHPLCGAMYLASAGVNQQTGGWDVVVLRSLNGNITLHQHFRVGAELPDKAASVAVDVLETGPFRGHVHLVIGVDNKATRNGEGGLFDPFTYVIEG